MQSPFPRMRKHVFSNAAASLCSDPTRCTMYDPTSLPPPSFAFVSQCRPWRRKTQKGSCRHSTFASLVEWPGPATSTIPAGATAAEDFCLNLSRSAEVLSSRDWMMWSSRRCLRSPWTSHGPHCKAPGAVSISPDFI
jgi:hypothetical protein